MRESAWSDYEEPCYVAGPGEGMVFFGANPSWTPAEEGQPELGCSRCGGLVVQMAHDASAEVPIPFRYDPAVHRLAMPPDDPLDPSSGVCGGCLRWVRDPMLARRIEEDFRRRGTVDPVPVAIVEDETTVPLPVAHIQATS